MIHKVGLLPKDNHQQISFAWKMYQKISKTGWDESNAFRKSFSIEVLIEFLGVWYVDPSRSLNTFLISIKGILWIRLASFLNVSFYHLELHCPYISTRHLP